jgi:branched-chain amino acid transport system substrate-binding protein
MAYFAYNSLNARTAVVLQNKDHASFNKTSGFFAQAFKDLGGRIIAIEPYSDGANFANILNKYKAAPPHVIYCADNFIPAAYLVNAAFQIGFKNTPLLGSDAWDGLLAYVHRPAAMKNVYFSAPFSFDDQDENVAQFVRNYFGAFSQMPLSGSAAAYTCVYILAEAIKKAGNTNRDNIISAMQAIELDTIIGRIKFDENNNPRTNVYIIKIEDGVYATHLKLSL